MKRILAILIIGCIFFNGCNNNNKTGKLEIIEMNRMPVNANGDSYDDVELDKSLNDKFEKKSQSM